ncbi:MAG: hypothetical protein V9G12_17355 [Microthrixaceae bacterium]
MRVVGVGEPSLQGRAEARETDERQADRHGQDADDPPRLPAPRRRSPVGQRQRQGHHACGDHGDDHDASATSADTRPALGEVRHQVPGEQGALEEHHGGVPDGGRPAEEGQELAGHHRLDQEQQGRPEPRRQAVRRDQTAAHRALLRPGTRGRQSGGHPTYIGNVPEF